jgi:ketosteroid isomerase-like protein
MPMRPLAIRPATSGLVLALFAMGARAAPPPLPTESDLAVIVAEVKAAETAFAKTMADRRLDLFTDFVAEDAVFNGASMNIGRATVVDKWRAFFAKPQAPFSWAPDAVAVAADGRTAVSTGPVRTPDGKMVSRFTSIWRKDPDGHWRVIADQGVDACECPPAAK